MKLLLVEHFRTARESLRRTKSRTSLTVIGIAIGIGSITAILALGAGMTTIINQQITKAGDTTAIVRPLAKSSSLLDFANPTPQTAYSTSPITERDATDIADISGVKSVVPLMTIGGSVRSSDNNPALSNILATTPEFAESTDLTFRDGQFIDSTTLENTAVIGRDLALDLFATDDVVGRFFTIQGQRFTVIGVLASQDNPINFNNVDLDHTAVISLTSGKLLNQGVAQIQQLNVTVTNSGVMPSAKKAIADRLTTNHNQQENTVVLTGSEISAPTSRLLQLFNAVIAAIAGISLLVGGVGVMNVMLVGVSERTREIGLRKAVGASNRSIVVQFMIESIVISLVGGIAGYVAGYALAFSVSLFLPFDPAVTWQIAALAAGLSVGVGTVFGIVPAYKAAQKHPIESLRRLH